MKKLGKVLSVVTLVMTMVFGMNTVKAFDMNAVNLDNDISFSSFITNGKLEVYIYADKANNQTIKYQFIEVTEAEVNSLNLAMDNLNNNYDLCKEKAKNDYDYQSIRDALEAEGKDWYSDEEYRTTYNNYVDATNTCIDTYNAGLAEAYKAVPAFDNTKWQTQAVTEEDTYSLDFQISEPADKEYFVMWVNAKDDDNNDIYNLAYKKSSSYVEPEKPEDTEQPSEPVEPETPEVEEKPEDEEKPVVLDKAWKEFVGLFEATLTDLVGEDDTYYTVTYNDKEMNVAFDDEIFDFEMKFNYADGIVSYELGEVEDAEKVYATIMQYLAVYSLSQKFDYDIDKLGDYLFENDDLTLEKDGIEYVGSDFKYQENEDGDDIQISGTVFTSLKMDIQNGLKNYTEVEKEDVESTVENPDTGLYISFGIMFVSLVGALVYATSKKKNYFSKI